MGYKITGFMISIVIIGIFMTIAGLFLANLESEYGDIDSYDNDSLSAYNKLALIENTTERMNEQVVGTDTGGTVETSEFDIIGSFFANAYSSLKLVGQSFTAFTGLTASASEDLNLGASARVIQTGITAIVLIIIVIGILLGVVLKVKGDGL